MAHQHAAVGSRREYEYVTAVGVRTRSALVPTSQEHRGDFSATRDASGRRVRIVDPVTGRPFESATIPADRISPQAEALLAFYPKPNLEAGVLHNFQTPVVTSERRNAVQTRLSQALDSRNVLTARFSYRRTTSDDTTLFGFHPSRRGAALDTRIRWSHQVPYRARLGIGYGFSRLAVDVIPHFANVANVSANAGIAGNNRSGLQPRLGLAWRPRDGSSFIVRGSYGLHLDTSFYGALAAFLAHQPPCRQRSTSNEAPSRR